MPALLSSKNPSESNLLTSDADTVCPKSMGKPITTKPHTAQANQMNQQDSMKIMSTVNTSEAEAHVTSTKSTLNSNSKFSSKNASKNRNLESDSDSQNHNIDNNNSSDSDSEDDDLSDDLGRYDQDLENIYDEQFQCGEDERMLGGEDDDDDLGGIDGESDEFCIMDTADDASDDQHFDAIVGKLEDIAISSQFQDLMLSFCQQHCDTFEDTEENKLEYTEIFNKWTTHIEGYIENQLKNVFSDFSTATFLQQLCERQNIEQEIVEDVLELLVSLSDFETFKGLMLNHKAARPERRGMSIKGGMQELSLSGVASKIH